MAILPVLPPQRWALAPAAIMVRYNLEDPVLLGGMPPGEQALEDARDELEGWEVTSAASARKVLARLAKNKHELTQKQHRYLEKRAADLGDRGLFAYSQSNIPHVAGLAYLAGFLDEPSAWDTCLAAARRTQQAYASWEALGREFLIGWECFEGKDPALHHVYRALVLEKNGTWSLPWNTPLG